MGRTLKALQQIAARSDEQPPLPESAPPEELKPRESPPPRDAARDAPGPESSESAAEKVAEATLAMAEDAVAAAAAETVPEPPAEAVAPRVAVEIPPRQEAEPAESEPLQWPVYPTEVHAQAYGKLAHEMLCKLPSAGPASLMFTSPTEGAGKTGLLVSLAASLVERTADKVLAVDANLRNPSLAARLGVRPSRGLPDVLAGTAAWPEVVCNTGVRGLQLLPGAACATPEGWLPEKLNLESLLQELNGRYRFVLLDTASLTHGEVAPMAASCTGTYLVVRLNHTTCRAAREAANVIQTCGGRLLGCVVLGC